MCIRDRELGISTASLSKMAYKTRVALLKQLIARYEMMRREGALPLVVGLMHLKAGPDVVFEVIDRFLALLQMICFRHNVRFLVDEATCAPVFPALLRYLAQNGRGETWMELVTPGGDVERRYAAAFHQVIHGESQAVAEIADVLLCGGSMERTSGNCLSAEGHVVLDLENAPEVVSVPTPWLRGAAPKGRGGE
mgnify:CR=1 FL=1